MNRRELIVFSGAALAAQQGMAQVEQISRPGAAPSASHVSPKILLKYNRSKSATKIPKTEAKATKYLNSLNALLALSPGQQQQGATILSAAVAARAGIRGNMKVARQGLTPAIRNNDSAGINQLSMALGSLKAQLTAAGANANAAFYGILTTDQQNKLTLFRS